MTPSASTNDSSRPNNSDRLDRIGGLASTACAIHCLIAPVLFLTLPAFAEIWAHPASHALMAIWVVPMALTVVIHGYRKHRQKWVSAAALVGIACILTGSALPYLPADSNTLTVDSTADPRALKARELSSKQAACGYQVALASFLTGVFCHLRCGVFSAKALSGEVSCLSHFFL